MNGHQRPPATPRPDPRRRGLTLIELLLVMALLATVMGVGLGTLASLDPGRRAALGLVQDVLRTAHNTAVARRAPARVRIDRAAGTLAAEGVAVIGTWHFEDERLAGADGMDGVFVGTDGELVEDGWLGRGLSLERAPRGARVEVAVQDDPAYDLARGFAIELAYRPGALRGARLLALGDALEVEVSGAGAVTLRFHRRDVDAAGAPRRGGPVSVTSPAAVLRPGRWTVLGLQYDLRSLSILADGVTVAATPASEPVWRVEGPLLLGGGSTQPSGTLDQLVVAVAQGDERSTLLGGVRFGADAPAAIQFAAGGALDPTLHPGPVLVPLEFDDGRKAVVRVGLYGTVE